MEPWFLSREGTKGKRGERESEKEREREREYDADFASSSTR